MGTFHLLLCSVKQTQVTFYEHKNRIVYFWIQKPKLAQAILQTQAQILSVRSLKAGLYSACATTEGKLCAEESREHVRTRIIDIPTRRLQGLLHNSMVSAVTQHR